MRNPGNLFVGSTKVGYGKEARRIWYVYLQGYNDSKRCISSHLTKDYAINQMKELKAKFKDELGVKRYWHNQEYLPRWLQEHVASKETMEFAFR